MSLATSKRRWTREGRVVYDRAPSRFSVRDASRVLSKIDPRVPEFLDFPALVLAELTLLDKFLQLLSGAYRIYRAIFGQILEVIINIIVMIINEIQFNEPEEAARWRKYISDRISE